MAVMIPEIPNPFQTGSLEDVMFEALRKLPDSCMVFHSFRLTEVKDGILNESEMDFIILDRERGILCLEAKAGAVSFRDGGCTETEQRCVREVRSGRHRQTFGN